MRSLCAIEFRLLAVLAFAFPTLAAPAAVIDQDAGAGYVAFEAEDADAILNPDAANDIQNSVPTGSAESPVRVWELVSNPGASGGRALQAPSSPHAQVADPSLQESLALYRIRFQTPATYHFYCRGANNGAPGNGGTNSAWRPDGFGDPQPDNPVHIVTTGDYGWYESGSYTVEPSDVGNVLELHIGVREPESRIDAFVFALASGLSEDDLDAFMSGHSPDTSSHHAFALEYEAPFLTDADMRIYFTNTHGMVEATSSTSVFYHPRISGVRADGAELPVLSRGAHALRVPLAPGIHEIEIETADEPTTSVLWPEARDPRAVGCLIDLYGRLAAASPGDEVVVANGVYSGWSVALSKGGAEGAPVVVRPETPGGVLFRGGTKFVLAARHVVLKGFRFDHPSTYAIEIDGVDHTRVTQCQVFSGGAWTSTFGHTVTLDDDSHYNRLDHNYFAWMKSMSIGQRIGVGKITGTHNRFDHNIFRDIYRYSYNGQENIQVGQGNATSTSLAFATVEYNLFDNAWGDGETISDKSSGNTTRHNVAAHNRGAFTYRVGRFGRFEGNVIVDCQGGLRAYDAGHTIVNNLIVGCSSYGISFHDEGEGHAAVSYSLVANNTIVNCAGNALDVGSGNATRRRGNRFINNLLVSNVGQLIADELVSNQTDPLIDNNLLWATGAALTGPTGTNPILADPDMTTIPGLTEYLNLRPSKTSPAIDAGAALTTVSRDRWQVGRPIGSSLDIGADEIDASGDFATTILLPRVPPVRTFIYDNYKHGVVLEYDLSSPLSGWSATGGASVLGGNIELVDTTITMTASLPPSFVMEWEYQSDNYTPHASVSFSGETDGRAYHLGVGGSASTERPAGCISLDKDGFGELLRSPDLQYHYMVYNSLSTAPDPAKWYRFRILKRNGFLRLEMNNEHLRDEMAPVLVWQDLGVLGGDFLSGERLQLVQTGSGRWRNVRIWETASNPTVPRIANTGVSATPEGIPVALGRLEFTGGGTARPSVYLLLDTVDRGPLAESWLQKVGMGARAPGDVSLALPGLAQGVWYFRYAALNARGWGVAPDATSFTLANQPPHFVSSPPLVKSAAPVGLSYSESVALDAFDPNGDEIAFAKASGPSWLTIGPNGDLSGTPASGDAGLNTFALRAADPSGAFSTTTLSIRVADAFFVRAGASGDGSTWDNAASLQDASSAASGANVCIGAGDYDIGAWRLDALDDQSWFGGFPPTGSPGMGDRDPDRWPTILNARMVPRSDPIMKIADRSGVAVDGIVFTQVNSTDTGGAMEIDDSQALVSRCKFTSNTAHPGYWDGGAGVRIAGSLPDVTLRACEFSHNLVRPSYVYGSGAGLRAWGGNVRVERCRFTENMAPLGAAISTRQDCMIVENGVIAGNRSVLGNEGGGALAARDAVTTVSHCTLYDNTTDNRGDAFIVRGGDRFHVVNSVLSENGATAIYATNFQPCTITIANTLFHGHATDLNSAMYLVDYGGNITGDPALGGEEGMATNPKLRRPYLLDLRLLPNSPAIDAALYGATIDYTGFPRPYDANGDGLALPDMGAYEMQPGNHTIPARAGAQWQLY